VKTPEQRAREAARRVLGEHNPAGRLPVPVEHIADLCGCKIARNQDSVSDITCFSVVSAIGDRAIGINTAQGVRSQRFAIAHALGHHQLHGDRDLTVCRQIRALHRAPEIVEADQAAEQQANAFALELILPADAVMNTARTYLAGQEHAEWDEPARDELAKHLGKLFNAPAIAVVARLVDLAILKP
jgi:Zn-dependent peptidase ImmA (M78 family)